MNTEEYTRTFSSFSGSDIVATFNGRAVGELQGITYSVAREIAPLYTMGSADSRGFSRGKRGITGTLVFLQFDRDALLDEMKKDYKGAPSLMSYQSFIANANGTGARGAIGLEEQILNGLKSSSASGANTYGINTWNERMTQLGYGQTNGQFDADNMTDFFEAEYVDQIMPFNVSISMANEFGNRAGMEIHGIQLMNESAGWSIDDVVSAKAYQFVARKIKPLKRKTNLRYSGSASAKVSNGDKLR